MSDTPDEPRPPGEDAGDQPPMAPTPQPPYESPTQQALNDLPPLDDDLAGAGAGGRRRWFSGGRLVAAGVVVVALLGGGAAFALAGGDDGDDGSDGVASVDGTEGDQAQGDDDGGGGNSGPADQSELEDAMLEYAECMRDHGIDMPDPEFSGDGSGGGMVIQGGGPDGEGGATGGPAPESDEFEAADEACSEIMEDVRGDMPQMSPEEIAEMQDKLVAMAECMRGKGYDMPDPQVSSDGRISIEMRGGGDGGNQGAGPDDQMRQDQEECNEEAGLENGPLGGGGSSGDDGSST